MGIIQTIKEKLFGSTSTVLKTAKLNKFPINTKISKIKFTDDKTEGGEAYVIVKNLSDTRILMDGVHEYLELLKDSQTRSEIFSNIYTNYSNPDKALEMIILTVLNDLFEDSKVSSAILRGSYILQGTYSDLSLFYFNLLVFGHPLLRAYTNKVQLNDSVLAKYNDYIIGFEYNGTTSVSFLRKHIVGALCMVLKVVFKDV